MAPLPIATSHLLETVEQVVLHTSVYDIHTHLYSDAFGELFLWGIDDLLVYHYLVAEGFRHWDMPCETFWKLDKQTKAELIWETLFLRHSPLSEACRGVLTTLHALGLDVNRRDLPSLRRWFASQNIEDHLSRVFALAGVHRVCMTNSPFDATECSVWQMGWKRDDRFASALRLDQLLLDWPVAARRLLAWGYRVTLELNTATLSEVRRFLDDWTRKMQPLYLMVSLPPDFAYPDIGSNTVRLLEEAVLPHCAEHESALALMPGVRRGVNPALRLAGDGIGRADLGAYAQLLAAHPKNRFLLTALSRENQHELCVLARKFRNLHPFGCWWFLNVPSLIDETTRMRIEMLGLSMTVQHSDARVLDQLIYKWQHSRRIIADVLKDKYRDLAATGWITTRAEIERDVAALFGSSFEAFLQRSL